MSTPSVAGLPVPALQGIGITKSYGGVRALKGVDLALYPGEVHSLCGENGSGKSTLLKILSAQLDSDAGEICMSGSPVHLRSTSEALRVGIATVTQERTLVPDLSVAENIMLGPGRPRRAFGIDWKALRHKAETLLADLDFDAPADVSVRELAPGQAQLVEIARALSREVQVLILDEPTSSLSNHEVECLFRAIRGLRDRGVAIVFISHRMPEVFAISDRITVLRDGNQVSTGPIADYTPEVLVAQMLGRELSEFAPPAEFHASGDALLTLDGLTVPARFSDVSLDVHPGEIVGIAGLVGAGQSEILEAIFGLRQISSGTVSLAGRTLDVTSVPDAIEAGIAFVPGDRKVGGLVLEMSVTDNMVMSRTSTLPRWRRPQSAGVTSYVAQAIDEYGIVTESAETPVIRLSGGNQQKVLIAKWIGTEPKLLLLDEPTRGVDVGAKAEIYKMLLAQRASGMSILISSSEAPELLTLCDRIVVMHDGRVAGTLHKDEATEELIFRYAMGEVGSS